MIHVDAITIENRRTPINSYAHAGTAVVIARMWAQSGGMWRGAALRDDSGREILVTPTMTADEVCLAIERLAKQDGAS